MPVGRIVMAVESRLFREGLNQIVASPTMSVVGDVGSLVEALAMLRSMERGANLLICDQPANIDQSEALKSIRREFAEIGIVILTEQITVAGFESAVGAGAKSFLRSNISPVALNILLELILLGEDIFAAPADTPRRLFPVPDREEQLASQNPRNPLSPRERQILNGIEMGQPNKTIARNLNMMEATVKVHLKAILRKINVQNRTQAAIWSVNQKAALSNGLPSVAN